MVATANESGLRVLAIDDEYLIALDVQYILADHMSCQVDVETTANLDAKLFAAPPYDVVIIDPEPINLSKAELAAHIASSGAKVIWSTMDLPEPDEIEPLTGVPSLVKPFSKNKMLCALAQVLERDQPEKGRAVAALLSGSGP